MGKRRRIAIALQLDEPYPQHQEVYAGAQRYAREHEGFTCVIDEHPGFNPRRRGVYAKPYDGVIARASVGLQRRLKRLNIPLVNTHYQAHGPGLAGVYIDPEQTGQLACEHLIERGFRRLSIQIDLSHLQSLDISQSFAACAAERGVACHLLDISEQAFSDPHYWVELQKRLTQWLDDLAPPVGLYIETAPVARQVIELCEAMGWAVPQDIAILCQQNLKAVVEVSPQISSIALDFERVGYEAAAMVDRIIKSL